MAQSASLIPTMTALALPAIASVLVTALRPRLRPDLRRSRGLLRVVDPPKLFPYGFLHRLTTQSSGPPGILAATELGPVSARDVI